MQCMVEVHGSDPAAKDLARVLRLPGTWHLKGDPHRVRIIEASGHRYTREELLAAFPPPRRFKPDPNAQRPKFTGYAPPGLESFHDPLKHIPAFDYGICISVGQALHHESGGSSEGLAMFDAWCATCSDKWALGWAEDKWRGFNGSGRTGGTIFALAEERGYVRQERTRDYSSGTNARWHDASDGANADAQAEDGEASNIKTWPVLDSVAAHGIIGEIAKLATANSEADPVAVMATALAWAGAMFGHNRYVNVGDSVHHPRLFAALVGASSRARKGTSLDPVRRFFNAA